MAVAIIGDNPGGGTVGAVFDAEIAQQYPASTQGSNTSSYLKAPVGGQTSRQLFRFDLSPIPSNAVVTQADLSILNADAMGTTRVVEMRKLLTSFVENQVSWNNRATATPWNVAGVITGSDVDDTVIATGTMPTTNTRFVISGAGFIQLVQDWVNGIVTNNGVILSLVNDVSVYDTANRRIANREGSAVNRPYLTITYTITTPPTVSVNDITVNNLSQTATFTVILSTPYASTVTVAYGTADNTATASVDYTTTSGTLTFAPGETSKSVVVPILP